jgi:predicted nucleic acid-binding protein
MISWPVEVADSKYSRWYEALITKAQNRTIDGYVEKHHVIPRSFGGNDGKANLVNLTAREHYIAHALLWKMNFSGVYNSKMAFAFNTFISKMTTEVRGVHHTYKISSRMYETFRKEYSRLLKEKYAREGGTWVGRKHTEESKRKIGEKSKLKEFKRGPENPNWGKKPNVSPEGKAARLAAIKTNWSDPVWKEQVLEKRKESNKRPEVIAARKAASDARIGVKRDPVTIEKSASKRRGRKGLELFSAQALANIREGNKNKIYTPDGKARQIENSRKIGQRPKSDSFKQKMSQRMKGIKRPTVMCEHCGKECVLCNYNRWHGDNCKSKVDQK